MGLLNTLRNISPSLYRLRILAVIAAVLVLPFILYYLLIVRSQTGYFTERSFRKLSLISTQITSKVGSVGEVLKNNSEKFIAIPDKSASLHYEPALGEKSNLDNLLTIFSALKGDIPQITPLSVAAASGDDLKFAGTVVLNSVRQDGDNATLYFTYVTEGRPDNHTYIKVRAKADLQNLLQPLLNTRTHLGNSERDQFQNIFISDLASGKVIFEHDTTQVRLAFLDKLTTDEAAKKVEVKDISPGSNVIDVMLAGTNYKLFSHPVEVPLFSSNGTGTNPSWIVSGLIQSDYFRNQTWSISYTILILCAFITALLILSWPLLKLVLIGPKDRLGTADIYFLTFSFLIAVGVFTALGLYASKYYRLESDIDSNLQLLATSVKGNFKGELTAALKQLDTLSKNCTLLASLGSQKKDCENDPYLAGTIYQDGDKEKKNILPLLTNGQNSAATTYPYFDTAVWIDKTGAQQAKWTIENETTQYINVSQRGYFSNLRRGNFYTFENSEAGLAPQQFWLEPIVSRTTGRNEVEISKLTNDHEWIAAFDARLMSLMQPVLPAGFGFVVVAQDGKVLFHSDEAHHLGENFFQECDDNARLRSAVVSRSAATMDVKYVGEGHRVLVTTFDDYFPEWSLIVFQNKQPLRSAFLELLTLVSMMFLIYTTIPLVCFSSYYLLNVHNERRAWLWPRPDKRDDYFLLFLVMIGLAIVSSVLTIILHGQSLPWLIAIIGMLSVLAFFLILRFGRFTNAAGSRPRIRPSWLGRYDVIYTLNLTFLLLLIAILPAAAFFKYAYESEVKAFIKHGQFTFAAELEKRDQAIRSQYSNIGPSTYVNKETTATVSIPFDADAFIKARSSRDWDIYDAFFFDTKRGKPDDTRTCLHEPDQDWLLGLYKFVPLYHHVSIERLGVFLTNASHGCCEWERTADHRRLVLHVDKNTDNKTGWPWHHVNTFVPTFEIPGPGWLVLFILAFFPFFFLVRFIVKKVFLLDVYKPSSRPLQAFLSEQIDRNVFVVVDAPFAEKKPSGGSNVYLDETRTLVHSNGGGDKAGQPVLDEATVLGLDNFNYQLDDPQTNEQKLSLLEKLLTEKRTMIIFSDSEPSRYAFKNSGNGHGDLDDTGRWARVMSQFFTEYAEDMGDPQRFDESVKSERERILKTDLKGRTREEVNELIDTLAAECRPKGPLQQIGLQILAQKSFVTLNREHLLNRIVNQAQPYYNHLFNSCSTSEKLTLFHLAKDRLLSHRDPDVGRLLRTELIVRDGDIHLLNESFRQFVTLPEQMKFTTELEESAKSISPWHTLKIPILVVLVAITIFLFVTQRDLYTSALAIVTAVTTVIPAFFKVLTVFHSDPFAGSSGQR